ncbi:hypothetical protein VUR80DRAFT_2131 [Thermomyces stellatus]
MHCHVISENLKFLLSTAVHQGVYSVVSRCLEEHEIDDALLLELPWTSCARFGRADLLKTLVSKWPKEPSKKRGELGSALLSEAVRNGAVEIVDIVVSLDFNRCDEVESPADVVLSGAERGFAKALQRVRAKHEDLFTGNGGHAEVLYAACSMGFPEVTKVLIAGLAVPPIVWQNEHGDTPLYVAPRRGHIDVAKLFFESRKTIIASCVASEADAEPASSEPSKPRCNDPLFVPDDSGKRPLQIAPEHKDQAMLSLLLDQDPAPRGDLSNSLHTTPGGRDALRRLPTCLREGRLD